MMKPFRSTLPLDEALAIVRDAIVPIARTERVPLAQAHDRVLATPIVAERDVPAFDRAAMDGYAVVAADTQGASRERPVTLALAGQTYAGDRTGSAITPGSCLEIATGAPLPPGADAVIMVEDTATDATDATPTLPRIQIRAVVRPGQHIVRRAADMRLGDRVLEEGAVLEPSRVGAIAAMGLAEVEVYAKPVVAILPTGNELVAPGQPLPAGHVYDVNRYTLGGLVDRHGGIVRQLPTLVDTPEAVRDALAAIRAEDPPVDLLVICGGSSVGERDLVIDALRIHGEVLFHGLAVKPGKPTAFARLGRTMVLGMPGNPTSCLSNAYVLMVPLLRTLGRLPAAHPRIVRAALAQRVTSPRGRLQLLPVRLEERQQGMRAVPTFKGSGEITSLSRADGYVTVAVDQEVVEAGTLIDVTLY